jgi:hypothetical protein
MARKRYKPEEIVATPYRVPLCPWLARRDVLFCRSSWRSHEASGHRSVRFRTIQVCP